jgi:SAM-dependent methyltransferase
MPKPTTSWGGVADWYDRLLKDNKDSYQREVILPHLLRLMAIKHGDTVLDLACGQGFFAASFLREGAKIIGADISPELVALAKKNLPKEARLHVAASHAVTQVKDGGIDKVAIVLAIQNIEDVKGTFAECGRVLKPGGTLHVVMNHPAFRIPKRSAWGWDKDGSQYRRVDGYLTESREKIEMHPGGKPGTHTVSLHRPLQFYVKALVRAGFSVTDMEEWISHKKSDSGPRAPAENKARREIPLFLYFQATKA